MLVWLLLASLFFMGLSLLTLLLGSLVSRPLECHCYCHCAVALGPSRGCCRLDANRALDLNLRCRSLESGVSNSDRGLGSKGGVVGVVGGGGGLRPEEPPTFQRPSKYCTPGPLNPRLN